MRRRTVATLALFCLAPAAIAWSGAREPLALQPQSRLWVDGTSTVRSFTCAATAFETRVESSTPDAVSAIVAGAKAVQSAELTVPAANLDCRNGKMNEHMLKALKADANPTIVFRITSYEVAKASTGVDGSAVGELTLGGVTRTITVTAHAAQQPGGVLRLAGAREIRMTEFGLKPPSLMMGAMKVDDRVTVGFDLLLKGQAPIG